MIWASLNIRFVGLVTFCLQLIRVLFRREMGECYSKKADLTFKSVSSNGPNSGQTKRYCLTSMNQFIVGMKVFIRSRKQIYGKPHQTPDCCFQSLPLVFFVWKKRCQLGSKLCLVFWAWKKLKEHAVVLSILYQMLEGKSFQFRKRWKHKHKNNFTELYRLFALNKFDDGRVWPFVQKGSPEMGKNPKLFAKFHNQWCDNLYFVGMFAYSYSWKEPTQYSQFQLENFSRCLLGKFPLSPHLFVQNRNCISLRIKYWRDFYFTTFPWKK